MHFNFKKMKFYIIYHYLVYYFRFHLLWIFIFKFYNKGNTLRSRSMIKISHVLKLSCQNDKILSPDSIEKKDGRLFSSYI